MRLSRASWETWVNRSSRHLSLRLARGMLWASLGILFFIRVGHGYDRGFGLLSVVLAATSYPALIALLAVRRGPMVRYALLALVVLTYLVPFPIIGWQWSWMPWTVAAAVLCALPARWAWPLFVLLVGGTGVVTALLGYEQGLWSGYMIITADDGLIVFSVAALVGTVERLSGAEEELARLALIRERLRLDGELRVVLGGKLQAIAFRLRIAARDAAPEARQEIQAATQLARRTLAEIRATAGAYRTETPSEDPLPVESPGLARRVLLAVLAIQCLLVLSNFYYYYDVQPSPLRPGLVVLGLGAILALQLVPQTRVTFLVQALLIVLPIGFEPAWDRVLSFFTGGLLLRVRPPWSWLLVGATLAAHFTWLRVIDTAGGLANDLAGIGGHVMLMWLVYSLGRLTELTAVLHRARHELAQAAVQRERSRIARDLHDVLGYSLTAVALKGELAERLLEPAPARARTELATLADSVGQAMVELDSIVGDRVELRFAAELDAAGQVLESAGIQTTARVAPGDLPAAVEGALATVLRETVTNVLRHSRARTCEITLAETDGGVRLRVVNDGADRTADGSPAPEQAGSGLGNLAQRTGGRLTAGLRPGNEFEVVAEFLLDGVPDVTTTRPLGQPETSAAEPAAPATLLQVTPGFGGRRGCSELT